MEDIIKTIETGDIVKFKQLFSENMNIKVEELKEARKLDIAKELRLEGEEDLDNDDDEKDEDGEKE